VPGQVAQPVGVAQFVVAPGERCIGGLGVAMGYRRDQERTAQPIILRSRTRQRRYRIGGWVAYVTLANADPDALRVPARHPAAYLVPDHVIPMGAFPLTGNGKVDSTVFGSIRIEPVIIASPASALWWRRWSEQTVAGAIIEMSDYCTGDRSLVVEADRPAPPPMHRPARRDRSARPSAGRCDLVVGYDVG
jgi:hypothetical protein